MISNLPIAIAVLIGSFILFSRLYLRVKTTRIRTALVMAAIVLMIPAVLFTGYYIIHKPDGIWFINFRSVPGSEALSGLVGAMFGIVYAFANNRSRVPYIPLLAVSGLAALMLLAAPFVKQMFFRLDYSMMKDQWKNGICKQSSGTSCIPASCVTVVRMLGGNVTERELATESGTCHSGTEIWYVKRALRRHGYELEAHVARSLKDMSAPAVLGCGTSGHVVVLMSKTDSGVEIGDPLGTRKYYTWDALEGSYQPKPIYFVIKPAAVGK